MAWPPSQIVAGERVQRAKPEEEGANHQVGDVEHGKTPVESIRLRPGAIVSGGAPAPPGSSEAGI
jgi:hypothetical protein